MSYTNGLDKPSDYFNTVTYTGTGTSGGNTLGVTGVGFQPDLVWVKNRTAAVNHYLYDVVRGTGSAKALHTNTTDSEASASTYSVNGGVASLDSDGFTAYRGTDNTYQGTNMNGQAYTSWNWKAGGTASSNTSGSITSSVSANQDAGFSIVSYTGTGSNATIGHGLGVAPSMIIAKVRSGADNWMVGHDGIGWTHRMQLNLTNAAGALTAAWNNTAPTSSVFTVGTNSTINGNGSTYIAYCFAEKKGFSKFGSYTGNGSTDGTFVYTGFKPAFVIVKRTNSAANWVLHDNKRDTYNYIYKTLTPNQNYAEFDDSAYNRFDFLSNGFKLRGGSSGSGTDTNASGNSYIYMCFSENPFVTSSGIPACAR